MKRGLLVAAIAAVLGLTIAAGPAAAMGDGSVRFIRAHHHPHHHHLRHHRHRRRPHGHHLSPDYSPQWGGFRHDQPPPSGERPH